MGERGIGKIWLILLIGLLLAGGGGGAYWFWFQDDESAPVAAAEPREQVGPLLELPEIVTNLDGSTGRAGYIQVEMQIEVERTQDLRKLEERQAWVQNEILAILRSKTSEDVAGDSGMRQVGDEIVARLNSELGGGLNKIHFVKFIVQ